MAPDSPIQIDDTSSLSSLDSSHNDTPQTSSAIQAPRRVHNAFVLLPTLSSEKKLLYKPLSKSSFGLDFEARVDEIIGEYREGKALYYFARYDGGIARKYLASNFAAKYGDLVADYEKKKAEGTLAPFDPSAQYVHPLARVRVKIRISSSQMSRSSNGDSIPDSDSEGTEERDEDDDFDNDRAKRRFQPARATRSDPKDLPFSPRKTRARRVLTIPNSDSNISDDDLDSSPGPRRSTRARKATEILLDSDADYVDAQPASPRRLKLIGPKKSSRPPVTPLYGRVRSIKTLLEDPFDDDDDNAILRRHRQMCEKCHEGPAHKQLAALKKPKNRGRKRKRSPEDDFEYTDDEERLQKQGGWVQCLRCPVVAHWGCLAGSQQDEVLKAIREKDREDLIQQRDSLTTEGLAQKRSGLDVDQITEFICVSCTRGGVCMGCMENVFENRAKVGDDAPPDAPSTDDVIMQDASLTGKGSSRSSSSVARELVFRCFTCKRVAHYQHLPKTLRFEGASTADIAEHYQSTKSWLCADCSSYRYGLEKIIAWRPYPPDAVEPVRKSDELPPFKNPLPREYLVKWSGRSWRRLDWVPHMWLLSTNPSKLKNFIAGGTKVDLLDEPVKDDQDAMDLDSTSALPTFEKATESRASSSKPETNTRTPSESMPDAERRIPLPWKTVHRVLDVLLWRRHDKKGAPKRKNKRTIESSDEEGEDDPYAVERRITFEKGEQPSSDFTQLVKDWEEGHRKLRADDTDMVAWAFIKWDELGYEEASWDAPPRPGEFGYDAFKAAFSKFLESRAVLLLRRDKKHFENLEKRVKDNYLHHVLKDPAGLQLGQPESLKLMPFQVDGFNWLCNNWWNRQPCILADEMGLGKTVQMVSFLGKINQKWGVFPFLVVVPNSTITNWVREFERWAPNLRVVPFYGEKSARDVIKNFELFHDPAPDGYLKTKFHVLVTTYEAITNTKETVTIFKGQPRWEVLVVDEGQRLKSDSSLLFKKLTELNSRHRVIMTGTPLNNNMRELFNLMNFLDPEEWRDLEALEKQHEELTEDLVKDLHNRLRPYFLRRIKSEVLELPPKNEVIVPVTMTPLQREVYRSILSHNLEILKGLTQPSAKQNSTGKSRINNVLMQLRKCLQHPYLYAQDLEPKNLAPHETHEKLIDASAKLRFLKSLLSKLKERGNRVLLFSQFVIALDVIEDFLVGEGYKFLRLDGNTKGSVRQKAMDEFNKPGSEYFIFLLSTRAGGVGINLYTADTVIIFDPDFNPHQDLQAIARAYRYGQQKTCLVFKLMVKDSAEERIVQIGKKKLVLDHLIVQKMDDDEENGGEDVNSILTYGAQALFGSDQSFRDITYTEQDVENLIEKTQKEAVQEGPKAGGGLTFAFAKVWAADKDGLEEIIEEDQTDSWAQALEKLNEERQKEHDRQFAESGRGAHRRAAAIAKTKMTVANDGPQVTDTREKSRSPSEFSGTGLESDQDASDGDFEEIPEKTRTKLQVPLNPIQNNVPSAPRDCGLCGQRHRDGECVMIEDSENLVEYREMLILHADDEPWEERLAAINAIDELLAARGQTHLIVGQPLHPLVKPIPGPPPPKKMRNADTPKASGTGKSKRAPSTSQEQKAKKPPATPPSSCILCRSPTPHYLKDCSIVKAGSGSITQAIQLLESRKDGSLTNTIGTLRNLLAKAKAHERANESANAVAGPSKTSTS